MNVLKNTTALALSMCLQYANPEGVAVDATCGKGNDTLWLAKNFAKVYGFDIQEGAIEATETLVQKEGYSNVTLIHDSHENMKKYVKESPQIIIFNLGYLPGGDKDISTRPAVTLAAIKEALDILAVDGLLCITMYQGHSQGYLERLKILEWARNLDKSVYHCVHTDMINQPVTPPEIMWITKKK